MAIITNIEIKRGVAEIYFDDRRILKLRQRDAAFLGLREGLDASLSNIEKTVCARQANEAYEAALTILDSSARSVYEIKKKLEQKGFLPLTVNDVCARLKQNGLLNDKALAARLTEGAALSGKGIYAIKRRLASRGIAGDEIEAALNTVSDKAQLEAALVEAKKLARKYDADDKHAFKYKLSCALSRRGFERDTIESAVERILDDLS